MYPSGYMAQNRYTTWTGEIDRVAERTGSGIGAVHWQATSRNADGQIASMSVGNQTTSKGYDGFGRVSSVQTGGGTLQNGSYGFDALGNLTSRSDTPAGQSSQSLGYDVLNRLTTSGGVTVATYSATGNILTRNGVTYTTPATSHRLTSAGSTSYGYEADGNVTAITGGGNNRTVTPNAFNLPSAISSPTASLSYVYDGSHARIKETSTTGAGTATTYYLGGYEEHTRADGVLEARHYVATPEGIVGIVTLRGDGTSDLRYWHKDHLGSVAVIVDQVGAVKQKYAFDAWGQSQPVEPVRPDGGGTQLHRARAPAGGGDRAHERAAVRPHHGADAVGRSAGAGPVQRPELQPLLVCPQQPAELYRSDRLQLLDQVEAADHSDRGSSGCAVLRFGSGAC